jgi:hypothetical protein
LFGLHADVADKDVEEVIKNVKEPKIKLDKNPLIVLIHGYGSNEEDLFSFAAELPDEYYLVSARAPYNLQYGSYAWYAINFDADQNKFSDNELVRYETYAFLTFNFCETLYDRGNENLLHTWQDVIFVEMHLHSNWLNHPDNQKKYKKEFLDFLANLTNGRTSRY